MLQVVVNFASAYRALDEIFCGWEVYSFSHRHTNYKNPEEFDLYYDRENHSLETRNIGLRRKLEVGLAFMLSYFEHGMGAWGRQGAFSHWPDAMWDCARFAGIALWVEKAKSCPAKTYSERAKLLDEYLENFNAVWNGDIYECVIYGEDDDGDSELIDSCFYTGHHFKNMAKDIARIVGDRPFEIVGDVPRSVIKDLLERIEEHRMEAIKNG
jgi:hypothetical protein